MRRPSRQGLVAVCLHRIHSAITVKPDLQRKEYLFSFASRCLPKLHSLVPLRYTLIPLIPLIPLYPYTPIPMIIAWDQNLLPAQLPNLK